MASPGLSNRIKIKSYFLIKSNVFAQIESNRIQIESNRIQIESNRIQIESNEFFDFRYDSILKKKKTGRRKPSNLTEIHMKNSQKRILKRIVRYFNIYAFIVKNSFENWPFS
jgi:hypothetical protein